MLYIYDISLNLIGEGPEAIIKAGVLIDIYMNLGYIVSSSKIEVVSF